ncbi:MAG: CHAT domain-containing protein [Pyrinomonadaceae bacterium]
MRCPLAHTSLQLKVALVVGLIFSLTAPARPQTHTSQQTGTEAEGNVTTLLPGQTIAGELKGGAQRQFQLTADAKQYLSVRVVQQGIDLVVTLSDPMGRQLLAVSRQSDTLVPEPIAAVTAGAGVYRLTVRARAKDAPAGRYELQLEELRAATTQDPDRIVAAGANARGAQLQYGAGTTDALRRALTEYETAYKAWRAAGESKEVARTLGNIGAAYSALGDWHYAINSYQGEVDLLHTLGATKQEAGVAENIGWLYYHETHNKLQALDYLDRALKLYEASGARGSAARAGNMIGMIYNDLSKTADEQRLALPYFTNALATERELRNPYAEGDALSNLMTAWKNLQRPEAAIFYGKQAVNVYQSLRTRFKDLALEQDTQQTFLHAKSETYRTLADLLITEGRLPEAQQVLDMLKEEEYSELLLRGGSDAGVGGRTNPAPMTAEETEWQKRYEEIAAQVTRRGRERSDLLNKTARTAADEQRLSQLEADLTIAHQAFEKFLDRMANELGETKQAARVKTLREAEGLAEDLRELGAGAVALYTLVGADKYRIILITPDVERAYEYPITGADLARKVAAFREVLQDPHSDPRPLAQELYKIILGPVAKDLVDAKAQTLMWSLDGVLRYVPMATLHDGRQYLVEQYRNEIFTPASHARLKDQPAAKWQGLGFGVSKAQTGFNALPAVPQELHAIFRDDTGAPGTTPGVLPGKIMLDDAFTIDALRTALRQRYPLVHIASHFAFRPGNETESFLLLGDGSHLSLAQIKGESNLFGGVELLTLSACDTASGGAGADGREIDGLGMVAQRQGAKAVIATLWPVADASTQLLMRKFYEIRDAKAGTLKVEALRQAQLALLYGTNTTVTSDNRSRGLTDELNRGLKAGQRQAEAGQSRSNYAHPFFWAPFTLIGNWK